MVGGRSCQRCGIVTMAALVALAACDGDRGGTGAETRDAPVAAPSAATGASAEPPAPPSAPAPEASQDASPPRDTHGRRNAGRKAPEACRDLGEARVAGPPTPLFDADDHRAQGTDVSDAQGDVPWRALHEGGVEFVYIRASEGHTIRDKHFTNNWAMARACGVPRGSYHVFEPTQDVDEQVAHFLGILGDDHGELPAVLDIEITPEMVAARNQRTKKKDVFPPRAAYTKAVLTWLTKVEAATGKRPIVYIQPWYWHSFLGKSADLIEHRLWAAGSAPRAHDGWPWTFWQHGQPAHWDARVWDRDVFQGSPAELDALIKSLALKK